MNRLSIVPLTVAAALLIGGLATVNAGEPYKIVKDLRVLVVVYRGDSGADAKDRIDDQELASIKKAIECGRMFYYRNSFAQLNLNISYLTIDTPAPETAGPTYDHIVADLRSRGVVDNQYDGVFTTGINLKGNWGGFRIFDKTGACFGGGGTGGQLRQFPSADENTGYDWAWTFVHEFQHALDLAIAGGAGFSEFIHGHPYADSAEHPGRVIENPGAQHWDWEACTLRNFKHYAALPGATSSYILCVDADSDGMPDYHPSLPTDEKRLGSDPTKADTDGDGLSDLEEFTADIYLGSDPLAVDSDQDGIDDGSDRWPTVAINPTVHYANPEPQLDGQLDKVYSPLIGRRYATNAPDLPVDAVKTFACWTEAGLYFAAMAPEKCKLTVQIDTSGHNGFWEGGDTYIWDLRPDTTEVRMLTPTRQPWPGSKAAWGQDSAGNTIVEAWLPVGVGQGWSREINFGGQRLPEDVADGMILLADRFVSFNITVDLTESDRRVLLTPTWTMINTQLTKSSDDPDHPTLRFTDAVQSTPNPTVRVAGIANTTRFKIVSAAGETLGEGMGQDAVRLAKVTVGNDTESGANTIYAVTSDGVKSPPFTLTVDAAADAPQLERTGDGQVKVVGEPGGVAVIELQDGEAHWRPIATTLLDGHGVATVAIPQPLVGFYGEYFDELDFTQHVLNRIDPRIQFAFQAGSPAGKLIGNDGYSVRWTGHLTLMHDTPVTFFLSTDDGSRLYIDDELLIDHWGHHEKSTKQADITLSKGTHVVRVDYYEEYGWASADLEVAPAGGERTFDLPVTPFEHMPTQLLIRVTQTDPLGNVSDPSNTVTLD